MTVPLARRIATHEAAHAIVGIVCGLPVAYATIVPSHDTCGHVGMADTYLVYDIEADATMKFAGQWGEEVLLGSYHPDASDNDFYLARKLIRMYHGTATDQVVERLCRRAEALCGQYRRAIEAAAELLLDWQTIEADELRACIEVPNSETAHLSDAVTRIHRRL